METIKVRNYCYSFFYDFSLELTRMCDVFCWQALLADDPALLLRESMGITAESTTRAFKQPSVDELMMRVKPDPVPVKHIFVAIDPSGGGESAFGIATIACLTNGDTMVRRYAAPPPHRPSSAAPFSSRPLERIASLRHCVIAARLVL